MQKVFLKFLLKVKVVEDLISSAVVETVTLETEA